MHEYVNYARQPLSSDSSTCERLTIQGNLYIRGTNILEGRGGYSRVWRPHSFIRYRIYLEAGRVADDSPRKSVSPYLCHTRHLFLSSR